MMALKLCGRGGEIITSPFTFVATLHAIVWAGFKPVFADIDPVSLNIDPASVEKNITASTRAILPVHCFGHACDVARLDHIGRSRNIKVVYDAAHAVGVKLGDTSLAGFGDMSVFSFHAAKVFTTFEGGAVICKDEATKIELDRFKNFGIVDESNIDAIGLNGKMNEFSAAVGLHQLKYLDQSIRKRRSVDAAYRRVLAGVPGIRCVDPAPGESPNGAYFPILVDEAFGLTRDELCDRLVEHGIYARRYFHPLISALPLYRDLESASPAKLPNATAVASKVLCLPIYPDLSEDDASWVGGVVGAFA
jgi:dTDP-4-amino-4,6-dideoxygalactose transaminase